MFIESYTYTHTLIVYTSVDVLRELYVHVNTNRNDTYWVQKGFIFGLGFIKIIIFGAIWNSIFIMLIKTYFNESK